MNQKSDTDGKRVCRLPHFDAGAISLKRCMFEDDCHVAGMPIITYISFCKELAVALQASCSD